MSERDSGSADSSALLRDDRRGAEFSEDREYRYRLWRTWDATEPTVAFVMLNPSTADENANDPTIRRCINFAKDWGYGTLEVVNLFGLRATAPSELREHDAPVGPNNDDYLKQVCRDAEMVVVAWGANGSLQERGRKVAQLVGAEMNALDRTQDGHPVHPLYQPADAEPIKWGEWCLQTATDQEEGSQ